MRRDVVGLGLGFLNPVNQIKAAYGVVSNPLNPMKQTSAMLNLFRGGRGPAPPPGYGAQYMPPGAYMPQQPPPGFGDYMQQQYAPPPPPGYPPGFAPQAYPSFAPPQMYGGSTGWDAAYSGAPPDPWASSPGGDPWAGFEGPSY